MNTLATVQALPAIEKFSYHAAVKLGLSFMVLLVTAATTQDEGNAQTCNVCNCKFNNVKLLSQLIEKQVNKKLADEPRKLLIKLL